MFIDNSPSCLVTTQMSEKLFYMLKNRTYQQLSISRKNLTVNKYISAFWLSFSLRLSMINSSYIQQIDIIAVMVWSTVGSLALVVNLTFIIMYCIRGWPRRVISNILISQSIGHILYIAAYVFPRLAFVEWQSLIIYCNFFPALQIAIIIILFLHPLCISIDCYLMIFYPMYYRCRKVQRKMRQMIIIIWVVAIVVAVISLVTFHHWSNNGCNQSYTSPLKSVYTLFVMVVCACCPFIITVLCYWRILKQSLNQPKASFDKRMPILKRRNSPNSMESLYSKNRAVAKLMAINFMLFSILSLPFLTLFTIRSITRSDIGTGAFVVLRYISHFYFILAPVINLLFIHYINAAVKEAMLSSRVSWSNSSIKLSIGRSFRSLAGTVDGTTV
ncbi:Octopamine receptor beta-3R [Trichoplax sp. H2]|nr:Octopamine receptor beta-3R [Trichoplax sp. H2]|eukprot:RDD39063.1 Octopamine receptor beta-3R [Trichoplax sp. H2]